MCLNSSFKVSPYRITSSFSLDHHSIFPKVKKCSEWGAFSIYFFKIFFLFYDKYFLAWCISPYFWYFFLPIVKKKYFSFPNHRLKGCADYLLHYTLLKVFGTFVCLQVPHLPFIFQLQDMRWKKTKTLLLNNNKQGKEKMAKERE